MVNLAGSHLLKMVIHSIGNKYNQSGSVYSDEEMNLSSENAQMFFPDSFSFFTTPGEVYRFDHANDTNLNEMYSFAKKIFKDRTTFLQHSKDIAIHLYEQGNAPNINSGNLVVCFLDKVQIEEKEAAAIAIIKCDYKNLFITSEMNKSKLVSEICAGINVKKYDKACLIVDTKEETGYQIISLDKHDNTNYWQREFLNIVQIENQYGFTNNFLKLTKDFITAALPQEFETSKTDQANLLNKSISYFKANDTFDINEFQSAVLESDEMIDSFQRYGATYSEQNNIDISNRFDISDQAVKKQARVFKSVLKLDKNFHIYIHGDNELIEKGYDEKKKMSYYKVYFREEV